MNLNQFFRIVEIRTKIVSVSSFLVGTSYALYRGAPVEWVGAAMLFAALLMIDMGTTAFNSFFDFYHGVDALSTNREKDKVLVHQNVAPGVALLTALTLYVLASLMGALLAFRVSWIVIPVGLAGMAVGYFYNGGKRPISSTPVGELFAGGFLGACVVVTAYAIHARAVDIGVLLVSLPQTIFIAGILTANNTCDMDGDSQSGRRTLSIVVGRRLSAVLLFVEIGVGWLVVLSLAVSGLLPSATLWFAGPGAAVTVGIAFGMARRGFSHATKGATMGAISQIFVVYTVAVVGGIVVTELGRV